jgi:uroporphyrin-III C-methyltransferase/precorrin-2 dehydrogenase/sirohydrochlorin ferrochelatase
MSYPISVHLDGQCCLIVGGGAVALRKARGLLDAGARVIVVSPELAPDFPVDQVTHLVDRYQSQHLDTLQPLLVFAATDDAAVNRAVVHDARERRLLVNAVDMNEGEQDTFNNMIVLERPPLTVAVSTDGASPVLGQHLRDALDAVVGTHYPTLAHWLEELRPQVIASISDSSERRAFWRRVMASDVLALLHAGHTDEARTLLTQLYNEAVGEYA